MEVASSSSCMELESSLKTTMCYWYFFKGVFVQKRYPGRAFSKYTCLGLSPLSTESKSLGCLKNLWCNSKSHHYPIVSYRYYYLHVLLPGMSCVSSAVFPDVLWTSLWEGSLCSLSPYTLIMYHNLVQWPYCNIAHFVCLFFALSKYLWSSGINNWSVHSKCCR